MTVKEAIEITGGLSKPSKMPGHGYSIPATSCVTGSRMRKVEGSVCSSCYACKGRYMFPNTQRAMKKRLEAISDPRWEDAMVTLLEHEKCQYFRWHDSGDLQNEEHLKRILNIARRTPVVKHWVPTIEIKMLQNIQDIPENVNIRISSPMINKIANTTVVTSFKPTISLVATEDVLSGFKSVHICPATVHKGRCDDFKCRACWDRNVAVIVYKKH
jgi:hypothetical protein